MDGLAADGIRFSEAFSPSPITNTSHATILTGLLPMKHGVTDFGVALSPAHPSLAEFLGGAGYHSAAFIGSVVLDSKALAPGFDRGFDFYDNFPEHTRARSRWGRLERRGMDVVHRAEQWLNSHTSGPRFVWLHVYDPHDPYEPPAPYSQRYRDHLYDGEIAYADSAVASFVVYLKARHRYENSLIVIVGDHGEGLGEHNEDTHGIFLYDSTTHVPLILKLPGGTHSGLVIEAQVRTTDIVPTLLDLTGVPVPAKLDGESLSPLFTGKEERERTVFGETDYPLRFGWAPLRSVREEGFKFIEAPRPEFFDLRADTRELNNKYESWDPRVQRARVALAGLRAEGPSSAPSRGSVGHATTDELAALGYLSSADAGSSTSVPEPSLLPDPKDKIEEQNLLHAAMIAIEDSRTSDARRLLEKALRLDSQSPNVLRELGEVELRTGNFSRAAQYLKSAVAERPGDAAAAFDEGQALVKIHDLTGAREALESSLKLAPAQSRVRVLLGQVYLDLQQVRSAQDQFEAALLLQTSNLEAQLGLARVHIAEGNFGEVVHELEPLSRAHPETPEIFENLSEAYSRLGRNAEARNASSRAKLLRQRRKTQPTPE